MATTVFGVKVHSHPVTCEHWAPKMIEQSRWYLVSDLGEPKWLIGPPLPHLGSCGVPIMRHTQ